MTNREKAPFDNELAIWQGSIDDYVTGLAWSHDGQYVYVLGAEGSLHMLESATGKLLHQINAHPNGGNALAVSPTDYRVVTTGKDGAIRLYHGQTGELLREREGGALWVEHAAWSINGSYFATTAGRLLRVWTAAGELVWEYGEFASTLSALYWRTDEEFAVACYGSISLCKVRQVSPFDTLVWKTPMISLTWRPDGNYLLAGTQDARVQVWELPYVPGAELEMSGYSSKVKCLSWHRSGEWIATNCGGEIVLWNMQGNGPEGQKPNVLRGHVGKITQLSFQRRGDLLISCDAAGLILIRHPKNAAIRVEGASQAPVCEVVWSPDDEYVLFGTENGEITVWETPF